MLSFELNNKQFHELQGLKFWLVEKSWLQEREPDNTADIHRAHETICFILQKLDRLGVPFWVQNVVLKLQDNWRTASSIQLAYFLQDNNVTINFAA